MSVAGIFDDSMYVSNDLSHTFLVYWSVVNTFTYRMTTHSKWYGMDDVLISTSHHGRDVETHVASVTFVAIAEFLGAGFKWRLTRQT